jgi:hypothetical protein
MPRSTCRCVLFVVLHVLLGSGVVFAQSGLAVLRGTVTDPSRAVIPGATITLSEPATGVVVRTVVSDEFGNFEIPDVRPGTYNLQAELAGFKTFVSTAILLESGQTRRLDVPLQLGGTAEEVTVVGGAEVITSDSGAISGRFTAEEYQKRAWSSPASREARWWSRWMGRTRVSKVRPTTRTSWTKSASASSTPRLKARG